MYENYLKDEKYDFCKSKKEDKCKPDCKEILKKYHNMIAESNDLYNAANNIVDKEVAGEICDALRALIKAFKLNEKADEKQEKANKFLNKTDCDKKSKKCKEEACKAERAFEKENEYLYKAGDLLKEALEAIEKSVKFRKIGNDFAEDYIKCVHHKDEKKDCDCPNPIERYYK